MDAHTAVVAFLGLWLGFNVLMGVSFVIGSCLAERRIRRLEREAAKRRHPAGKQPLTPDELAWDREVSS